MQIQTPNFLIRRFGYSTIRIQRLSPPALAVFDGQDALRLEVLLTSIHSCFGAAAIETMLSGPNASAHFLP